MGDIIAWKTGAELLALLATQNALVSGMTASQAATALGFTKTAAGLYVKSVVTTEVTAATASTATAAAAEVTAGATSTAVNLTIYETASGTAAVGGLGSIALPIAVSMAAAAGGYLIGNAIYTANSEFLDNLMFPVYDFITGNNTADTLDDVPAVPMIINADGNVFLHPTFHYNIKSFLDAEFLKPTVTQIDATNCLYLPPIYKVKTSAGYTQKIISYRMNNGVVGMFYIKVLTGSPEIMLSFEKTTVLNNFEIRLMSKTSFTAQWSSSGTTYTNLSVSTQTSGSTTWYEASLGSSMYSNYSELVCALPKNYYPIEMSPTLAQRANLINATKTQISGFPSAITKYVPGASPQPLPLPDGMPAWKPVIVPTKTPSIMPEPVPFPTEFPQPDPEKITPYVPSIQPQPDGIPIKKPATVPSVPLVPLPDPTPDILTSPSPAPDPTRDPSVLPALPSDPKVPVAGIEPSDSGTTPSPLIPVIPPIASSAKGLLHVYNPTNEQINEFGRWLWTTFSGDLIDTLSKLFNNPMDAVIGLHEIYSTPIATENTTIKAGYLDSGVASRLVTTRYTEIKCGAIAVPEYWANYLDYSPYTKAFCYLPFIGIVELNADDIVGSGVEITYRIDTYNGSCIALITTAKPGSEESVIYEFSGNCSVEIPITSGMKSAMQSALIGAATAALAAATGGATAVGGAALVGGVRQGGNMKNNVQHSGSFGSSYGAMGIKKPYLIIKRPKQKVVPGYNTNYGYPAHKMVLISTCSGYLKAIEVDVVSPTATEEEKKMIEKQLKTGIFID